MILRGEPESGKTTFKLLLNVDVIVVNRRDTQASAGKTTKARK